MRALMSKNVSSTCARVTPRLAQQLVVDAVELALPDRARGLEILDRARTHRQRHHAHPAGDRAARDDDHLVARGVAARRPGRTMRAEDVARAASPRVLGDDARSELDDVRGPSADATDARIELEHDARDLDVVARLEARRPRARGPRPSGAGGARRARAPRRCRGRGGRAGARSARP